MITVRDILQQKGYEVCSIQQDAKVFEALERMAEKNIGALVVKEGEKVVGMISERDYARKVILKGKSSREIAVREIMMPEVLYVKPGNTSEQCMALMVSKRTNHLPVFDEGRLIGIISIGDVVNSVIKEKEFVIGQLEQYILGR